MGALGAIEGRQEGPRREEGLAGCRSHGRKCGGKDRLELEGPRAPSSDPAGSVHAALSESCEACTAISPKPAGNTVDW